MSSDKQGWYKAGEVGVDAGLIWIGDPCYCITPDTDEQPAETWADFVNLLEAKCHDVKGYSSWQYKAGHEGLGVCLSSGYGDGVYPVFVKKNTDGRIIAAIVLMDDREIRRFKSVIHLKDEKKND